MNLKKIELKLPGFLLFFIFLASCTPLKQSEEITPQELERQQWMKDYAFCKCLANSLGEEIAKEINAVDASKGSCLT
ncbi:hypothetical protein OB13_06215 [Pontibacter sp. HJ8]